MPISSTWTGDIDGNLNLAGNWTAGVPGPDDAAYFDPGALTGMYAYPDSGTLVCDQIVFVDGMETYGSMFFNGGTYTSTSFGNAAIGGAAFYVSSGTWNVPFMTGTHSIVITGDAVVHGNVQVTATDYNVVFTGDIVEVTSQLLGGTFAVGSTIICASVGSNGSPLVFNKIQHPNGDWTLWGQLAAPDPAVILAGNTVLDIEGEVVLPSAAQVEAGVDRGDGTLGTLEPLIGDNMREDFSTDEPAVLTTEFADVLTITPDKVAERIVITVTADAENDGPVTARVLGAATASASPAPLGLNVGATVTLAPGQAATVEPLLRGLVRSFTVQALADNAGDQLSVEASC